MAHKHTVSRPARHGLRNLPCKGGLNGGIGLAHEKSSSKIKKVSKKGGVGKRRLQEDLLEDMFSQDLFVT